MAVTGTVGRERPSGLIRDDEGNHGRISEGVVGEPFERGTPSALGAPLGPRDDHVVAGERSLLPSEPRRSDKLALSCCHLGGSWCDTPVGSVQESRHAVTGHPERPGTFGPGVAQLHELDVELVASRFQTRRLARPWPRSTGALELRLDRVPPLREVAQHLAAEALELGQAPPVRHEPFATELRDSLAKLGAIDRSRRALVQVDHAGVERGPSPVTSFYDIADDPMRMELRIELTRGRVDKAGDGEPRRDVTVAAPEPAPCPAALVLEE